jgi:two-component system NtrC family response regulator
MRDLVTLVQRTRDSRLSILITGESGTGKDHLARWIHSLGQRREGPFVAQDCSAIPPGLLEAEIFGYEAGAFTGASDSKPGLLLAAQGGTFYIDNVDSIPLELQAKLLRALERDTVRPLGGSSKKKLDVRFIASSQRDLKDLCAGGGFRKDLYFRLSGIGLVIPPLRERAQDVPLLIRYFCAQLRGGDLEFSAPAMEVLRSYEWPGNVRELESVVRRLALTADGVVDEGQVARVLGLEGAPPSFPRWIFEGRTYEQALDDVKREYLLYLYERFEGDIDRIAKELGLTKRNVYLRFSHAGIRPFEDRGPSAGA